MSERYADRSEKGREAPRTVLVVEHDARIADEIERRLSGSLPGLAVLRCETLTAARAYMTGTAFDAVCAADTLPDGSGATLAAEKETLGFQGPLLVRAARETAADVDGYRLVGETAEEVAAALVALWGTKRRTAEPGTASSADPAGTAAEDVVQLVALLEALRSETGAVAHAINNPLTVITGNAQLLLEVAGAGGLDPSLAKAIEDMGAASQQLSEALGRLDRLRQHIASALGRGDRLAE